MNKFYESVNEINNCITNSDAAGLRDALSKLWDLRDQEGADPAKMFSPYIFNALFLEHRELLDDPQLFDAWSNYYKASGYNFGFSMLSRNIFYLDYINGKVLNSIFLGETEAALDMLKKMEKLSIKCDTGAPFFENNYESGKFYYCIIDAAAEYNRPEILEYIAACAVSTNGLTEPVKILQYTGFLICRLIDKKFFDILDLIYKNTFDSNIVKMTHYINIQKKLEHSRIYYADQLLKRYGKGETDLCRLIDEADIIGESVSALMNSGIVADNDLNDRILSELKELGEIGFKTDNITALVNLLTLFTLNPHWNAFTDYGMPSYDDILELIKNLIGDKPVYHLLSIHSILSGYLSNKNTCEELRDTIKLLGGAISIDNIKETGLYSKAEINTATERICYQSHIKPIFENDTVIITDPIEENCYIDHLISKKSYLFDHIITKLTLTKDGLEALIPICAEHGNYNALNIIRKML
ncbi:MAG: hypothetical protein HDT44_06895 [Ruminococcaceae bacterium]|nr:hypothetical protein [Oscillospiraceae bacterium]